MDDEIEVHVESGVAIDMFLSRFSVPGSSVREIYIPSRWGRH